MNIEILLKFSAYLITFFISCVSIVCIALVGICLWIMGLELLDKYQNWIRRNKPARRFRNG